MEQALRGLTSPPAGLVAEVEKLRARAEEAAAERDVAKPREVRDRELRNRYKEVQGKLDKNKDKQAKLAGRIEDLADELAKARKAMEELEDIIAGQERKVRELHMVLGTEGSSSDDDDDEDDEDGEGDDEDMSPSRVPTGFSVVGRNGKTIRPTAGKWQPEVRSSDTGYTKTPHEAGLAMFMGMGGDKAAANLRESGWGGSSQVSLDSKTDRDRKERRSRSPVGGTSGATSGGTASGATGGCGK
jgi:hypothetical protein